MTSACIAFSSIETPSNVAVSRRLPRANPISVKTAFVRPAEWEEKVIDRLVEISVLKPGWDGYRALAVKRENIVFAMSVLRSVMDRTSPMPDIVPCTRGDLQIEWHTSKGDLELQIVKPNLAHAWLSIVGEDNEPEVQLTNDFQTVSAWLMQIKENEIAADRAAA